MNAAAVGPTAAYWQNMIKPLMPGDSYNLSCSGPVNTTRVPYRCRRRTTCSLAALQRDDGTWDNWTSSDPTSPGIAGIAGGTLRSMKRMGTTIPTTTTRGAGQCLLQFAVPFALRLAFIGNANYHAIASQLRKRLATARNLTSITPTRSRLISPQMPSASRAWGGLADRSSTHGTPMHCAQSLISIPLTNSTPTGWWSYHLARAVTSSMTRAGRQMRMIGGWQLCGIGPLDQRISRDHLQRRDLANQLAARWTRNADRPRGYPDDPELRRNRKPVFRLPGSYGDRRFPPRLPGRKRHSQHPSRRRLCRTGLKPEQNLEDAVRRGPAVQFRWEVFNVPNLTRFNVQSVTTGIDSGPSFGNYTGLLTNPRVMQFALRYDF